MKKSITLSLMALIGAVAVNATVLTPDQALNRALSDNESPAKVKAFKPTAAPTLVYTALNEGVASVYLFKAPETTDYLVVSADDIAPAILGYGDNFGEINPTMQWWLDEYGRQIAYGRANGFTADNARQNAPTYNYKAIAPMVDTRWNQSAPFNDQCPVYNNQTCVTGCVATALAQIMKYHNYPATGTGSVSYTTKTYGLSVSFNFGSTTFDWNNMLDVYTSSATTEQKNAVATLMYACGAASNMNYTPDASGASSFTAAQAMVKYFNYDKGIVDYPRAYYGLQEWNDLVYNQLVEYGPVQYSGQSNSGGHSFVCDGYSSDGYFHINWGWGGMSDGYFLLTALNPESQGIGGSTSGYNFDQDIIGNVKAQSGGTATPYIVSNTFVPSNYDNASNKVSLGGYAKVGGYVNYGIESVSVQCGFKAVSSTGNVTFMSYTLNDWGVGSGYSIPIQIPTSLASGTYQISPAFKTSDGTLHDIPVATGASRITTMTVSGNTATFGASEAASIEVDDFTVDTPFYVGSQFKITATITNNSDLEYSGEIILAFGQGSNYLIGYGQSFPVDLEPGETVEIPYISGWNKSVSAGTYDICFVDAKGLQLSGPTKSVTVNAASTPSITISGFAIDGDANNVPINEVKFKGTVNVVSGYLANALDIYIFPYIPGQSVSSMATATTATIFAESGTSVPFTATCDFSDGTVGNTYFASVRFGNSWVSEQINFTLGDATTGSIDAIGGETDAIVKTEYFNLNGIPCNGDNLVPGMYIVRNTMTDGSVKTSKTFIR